MEIIWNSETTPLDLADGVVTVGGGQQDGIVIEGLPHALLTLTVEGEKLSVLAQRSVRIGQALFPARIPRLVLEGEELKLPNDVILRRVLDTKKRDSRKTIGTAFVAQELLATGEVELQSTRAATLTCVTGLDQGRTFPVAFEDNFIGRADDATIRVRDRMVSRRHARLVRRGREYVLEPVPTSMNGAYVNGAILRRAVVLKAGDTIEVGHTVLRFDTPERAPGEQTLVTDRVQAPAQPPSGRVEATLPAPNPQATTMKPSEIKFAADAVPTPKAADVAKRDPALAQTLSVSASEAVPLDAAAGGAPPPRRFTVEVLLMSAGGLLLLLGMSAIALVLR